MKKSFLSFGVLTVAVLALFSSCSVPQDIAYFQDFNAGKSIMVQNPVEIKFKADDEIRIHVSSQRKELSDLFSLSSGTTTGEGSRYTIDSEGYL